MNITGYAPLALLLGMALMAGCTVAAQRGEAPPASTAAPTRSASAASPSPAPALRLAPTGEPASSAAAASGVPFPGGFPDGFVKYAVVERPDATRSLYIDAASLGRIEGAGPLPEGTVLVITGHVSDGGGAEPNGLHVAEKRGAWLIADVPPSISPEQWNFGSFTLPQRALAGESLAACFTCHRAAGDAEQMFSQPLLRAFVATGAVQEARCERPQRAPCGPGVQVNLTGAAWPLAGRAAVSRRHTRHW